MKIKIKYKKSVEQWVKWVLRGLVRTLYLKGWSEASWQKMARDAACAGVSLAQRSDPVSFPPLLCNGQLGWWTEEGRV